ncbi:dihydroxyacetone kinase subunit DhaL [Streptacidiphilus sp. MAP12-33]|uniref:dihydroxyacetone kinase subunit DhaL n=1 Tax=Streptacidiphilus sp. MAP12-33 TaxID=3156266 RepID=UPI0035154A0C
MNGNGRADDGNRVDTLDIATTRAWIRAAAAAVDRDREVLTALDAAIGDADHGANMNRGFTAVTAAIGGDYAPETVGQLLAKVGMTLISSVGGASGPLYGSAFRAAGRQLATPEADGDQLALALRAALDAVRALGAAAAGDKTMVDALMPAVTAFDDAVTSGAELRAAARAASDAADAGARATTPLQARKGRASYLGERSIGHQDPGATSTALIFAALADTLDARVAER